MSVDVIIPCYNYAHFLEQCVGGVLSQAVDGLRIIIIDNASTDDSVAVAKRLAERDSRIEVICHEKNLGPHASFNEGIDRASADYLMILCADDLLAEGALEPAIKAMEQTPEASFAIGAYAEIRPLEEAGSAIAESSWHMSDGLGFIRRCCSSLDPVAAHAILVRRSVQMRAGYYNPRLALCDDFELALRLAQIGHVIELSAPLAVRRIQSGSISEPAWNDRLRLLQERQAALDSFFASGRKGFPDADKIHRVGLQRIAEAAFWSAVSHLARGKSRIALKLFRYGYSLRPATMLLPPLAYLVRTNGTTKRVKAVMLEAFGRRNGAS
ncbi:glycosyltransferase family 2 protein [Pseudaminobacter soli (ex Li et al. 2025)]|uniref:Glycosyltransferase family 2 protein n=1 Tax=Pseudaminobacter soli (ex Li et al. 2025) TaxID=1295366 RepID=A0A2P7S7T5_9HYPH|nr:glycosyltransferase family 2 protein [Mesorhizobium soli]PSJ58548.1 glycosyltransferase family 2 protein [Mesorhizobium soli]